MIPFEIRKRIFAITAAFEGKGDYGNITGNFDGQVLSAGIFQWCLGQGSLQPLLRDIDERDPHLFETALGARRAAALRAVAATVGLSSVRQFAEELGGSPLSDHSNHIKPDWRTGLVKIFTSDAGVAAQHEATQPMVDKAADWCHYFGFKSERALSLMFDIRVQNGSINEQLREQMKDEFSEGMLEREKLKIVAQLRADAANPKWRRDVLQRKMCIVTGHGVVHGDTYDLKAQFGLSDDPIAAL